MRAFPKVDRKNTRDCTYILLSEYDTEMFYSQLPYGKLNHCKHRELIVRLEELSDDHLDWTYERVQNIRLADCVS